MPDNWDNVYNTYETSSGQHNSCPDCDPRAIVITFQTFPEDMSIPWFFFPTQIS